MYDVEYCGNHAVEQRPQTTPSLVGRWLQRAMHYVGSTNNTDIGEEWFTGAYFLESRPSRPHVDLVI